MKKLLFLVIIGVFILSGCKNKEVINDKPTITITSCPIKTPVPTLTLTPTPTPSVYRVMELPILDDINLVQYDDTEASVNYIKSELIFDYDFILNEIKGSSYFNDNMNIVSEVHTSFLSNSLVKEFNVFDNEKGNNKFNLCIKSVNDFNAYFKLDVKCDNYSLDFRTYMFDILSSIVDKDIAEYLVYALDIESTNEDSLKIVIDKNNGSYVLERNVSDIVSYSIVVDTSLSCESKYSINDFIDNSIITSTFSKLDGVVIDSLNYEAYSELITTYNNKEVVAETVHFSNEYKSFSFSSSVAVDSYDNITNEVYKIKYETDYLEYQNLEDNFNALFTVVMSDISSLFPDVDISEFSSTSGFNGFTLINNKEYNYTVDLKHNFDESKNIGNFSVFIRVFRNEVNNGV